MQTRSLFGMPRAHAAILALALALGLLACAIDGSARHDWDPVPPQHWQAERGPVVPHDTFPADCALCHAGETWHSIRDDFQFDHAAQTGVALVGAHEAAECLRCHNDRGPVARFSERGCIGCHEDIHEGKLGSGCTTCHEETAVDWRPKAQIAQHATTRFPLAGAHASTACWACHPGAQVGNFVQASTNCADCHQKDLAVALQPNHVAQGWTDGCQRCHLPTDWSRAGFEHGFFPLQGGHSGLSCSACHMGKDFGGLSTACFSCHASDYQGADNHVSGNFSTMCQDCHTINSWSGAHFNHNGITSGCIDCHASDYQTAPNHVAQNFSTACEDCHTTRTWKGANFSHAGITSGCIDCHASDYANTSQPPHASNGIGMSCEGCHTTRTWGDGTFTHPQFPITSGHHNHISCQECHPAPNSFRQFACINCHEHSPSQTNGHHNGVRGYSYTSPACYDCHPDGQVHD